MSDTTSIRRLLRSRPWWLWLYAALVLALLFTLMFVTADRLTQTSSRFEPTATAVGGENEFIPADRPISECISAIPKPGCGSEARGGWRQSLVLLAILAGLALIVWRIVASARRARREQVGVR